MNKLMMGQGDTRVYIREDVHPIVNREFQSLIRVEKEVKENPENMGRNVHCINLVENYDIVTLREVKTNHLFTLSGLKWLEVVILWERRNILVVSLPSNIGFGIMCIL